MTLISLTPVQIESLLDFITPNKCVPSETALSVMEIQKEPLRKQLSNVKIYPELLPTLKEELKKNYFSSLIQPGESVGVIAAQSASELLTQKMLSSFHLSGGSEKVVTQGVPRTNELLQVVKKPKVSNVKIFLKNKESTMSLQKLREATNHRFISLTLGDVSESMEICLNKIQDPEEWFDIFFLTYKSPERKAFFLANFRHCVKVSFKLGVLYRYRLSFETIAVSLEEQFDDVMCVFSPLQENVFYIFMDTADVKFGDQDVLFINASNYERIYFEEKAIPELSKTQICGVSGITNIFYDVKKDEKSGNEWFIETEGTNFTEILGHPDVEFRKTISNNVWDVYANLGIEAARHLLFKELKEVLGDINEAHILVIIDKMTFTGILMPISRYTLKKDDCGVISKASFEESVDIYLKSAFACEKEKFKGVSASIVCGKRSKIGTGMVDLSVDMDMLVRERT